MKDYFFSKLGVRLMLLVAFAMAPVLCFIVFTGFEQREMAMEAARQDAMRVARMAGANHESLIEGAHQLLIALSRIPDVQSGDKKTCDHFFSDLIKKYPSYLNFGMTDALGNIYVSAIPIAHPISASDRSWYQRTRLALDFSVGDYQIGRITHQGTVNFGYPILDSNGNYKGAIFAALSLNWVNQLAAKAQLPGGGIVLVVDSKGMILARNSEPEKWVGKPFQEHSVLKAIEDHREEASIETEGFDGIKRLYAVTLLKGGKDDGRAYVCVGIPSRLAFDHPIHVLRRNLALLGLATLLAMGAAWFFGNAFVLKSIQTLLHTTRRLSAGDMGARTGLRQAPGEMGELATAFDQMAATLEKRVKERQIVEQALRQSEERSRRVFQDAATGMIVISTTGAFWQVNQAFCDFVEYLEDELEALNVLDVTHPEDREIVRQAMQFVEQSTQGTSRSIQRFVKKNGEIRQGELSLSRVTSSKGTPGFFVAQILDVTERVEAQRRLEEQHASLEQANRAKDEFIAMLSHELRTPLTPVLICIDSFQNDTRLSEEIQSAFSMIRRNIQLEARLIDDLLDVAKVTFGKVDLHLEILEAHALLRNTLEICDPAIVSKGLLVQLDFQAEHHVLRADPSRLQQVFWNLVNNAVKFTPEHGTISIRTFNPAPDELVIEFTDTGEGIDPAIQPRIFNAFEQGRRQFGGGLGLGLAIAKGIVEAHDGTLSAGSGGVGCGATFVVKFKTIPEKSHPCSLPDPPPACIQTGRAARILLVEDHDDTRTMLTKLLVRHGYCVHSVNGVKAALVESDSWDFNLLVCDLGLPDGSGLDLIQELKKSHPTFNAISISGFGMDMDILKSKEAGFLIHLIKPVSVTKLESAIEEVLSEEKRKAES